jgi:hypothetical protein
MRTAAVRFDQALFDERLRVRGFRKPPRVGYGPWVSPQIRRMRQVYADSRSKISADRLDQRHQRGSSASALRPMSFHHQHRASALTSQYSA